jgi:hypothetical protein
MIRKSGYRFSEKIMLHQKLDQERPAAEAAIGGKGRGPSKDSEKILYPLFRLALCRV